MLSAMCEIHGIPYANKPMSAGWTWVFSTATVQQDWRLARVSTLLQDPGILGAPTNLFLLGVFLEESTLADEARNHHAAAHQRPFDPGPCNHLSDRVLILQIPKRHDEHQIGDASCEQHFDR